MEEEIQGGEQGNCREHLAVKDRLNILLTIMVAIGLMIAWQTLSQTPDIKVALTQGLAEANGSVRELGAKQASMEEKLKELVETQAKQGEAIATLQGRPK